MYNTNEAKRFIFVDKTERIYRTISSWVALKTFSFHWSHSHSDQFMKGWGPTRADVAAGLTQLDPAFDELVPMGMGPMK